MKEKEKIKLAKVDLLEMENIDMKIFLAKEKLQRLQQDKSDLSDKIKKKYRIDDLSKYVFNPTTGEARRVGVAKEAANV